jgi:hypothetical protein
LIQEAHSDVVHDGGDCWAVCRSEMYGYTSTITPNDHICAQRGRRVRVRSPHRTAAVCAT